MPARWLAIQLHLSGCEQVISIPPLGIPLQSHSGNPTRLPVLCSYFQVQKSPSLHLEAQDTVSRNCPIRANCPASDTARTPVAAARSKPVAGERSARTTGS